MKFIWLDWSSKLRQEILSWILLFNIGRNDYFRLTLFTFNASLRYFIPCGPILLHEKSDWVRVYERWRYIEMKYLIKIAHHLIDHQSSTKMFRTTWSNVDVRKIQRCKSLLQWEFLWNIIIEYHLVFCNYSTKRFHSYISSFICRNAYCFECL